MNTKTTLVLTTDLRSTLKELFARELEQLPAVLEGLEPKERLDYLLKLMPFVMPKVNNVSYGMGEHGDWGM